MNKTTAKNTKSLCLACLQSIIHMLSRWSRPSIYEQDFEECARTYDLTATRPLLAKITEELIAELNIKHGLRCVELGCGTGQATEIIAKAAAPGGSIVACDISGAMLEIAREKMANTTCQFIQKDMIDFLTEYPDNSIDLLVSFWAADYSNPELILLQANRVLARGGTIALLINLRSSLAQLQEIVVPILLKHPLAVKCLPPINFPPNIQWFERIIKHSGLSITNLHEKSCDYFFDSGESLVDWMKTGGPAAGFRGAIRENYREHIFDHIRKSVEARGGIKLTFRYLYFIGVKK